MEGFPNFRLIINLPCLSLEDSTDRTSNARPNDDHNKREWENLSHLPLESSGGKVSNCFAIYETRTTIVISGCNDRDWFGYALGSTEPVDTNLEEEEEEEDHESEPEEDFFASGGCESVFNPGKTIWDPRIYFLCASHFRLSVMTQASEYLVRKLDAECHDWVRLC